MGVDGTDKEITDAEHGDPPEGYDFRGTWPRVLWVRAGGQAQRARSPKPATTWCHRQTARYQHQVFVEVNGRA